MSHLIYVRIATNSDGTSMELEELEPGKLTGAQQDVEPIEKWADRNGVTCGTARACAQLTLEKALKCDGEDATDFPAQKDDISDFLKNPAYRMEEDEEVNIASYFKEGTRFLPSSCPPPKVFHLTTGGGRTFQFSYESICLFASDLGFLIVAAAGVFFAIYVGRAAGGE